MATNFEFYKDEILEISRQEVGFGVINGKVKKCTEMNCVQCLFYDKCLPERFAWLYTEHIEAPKLTKRERAFCEAVQTGWMVRDGKYLYWHIVQPIKGGNAFIFPNSEDGAPIVIKTKWLAFDAVKNKEIIAVEDLLKLDVMEVQHETD